MLWHNQWNKSKFFMSQCLRVVSVFSWTNVRNYIQYQSNVDSLDLQLDPWYLMLSRINWESSFEAQVSSSVSSIDFRVSRRSNFSFEKTISLLLVTLALRLLPTLACALREKKSYACQFQQNPKKLHISRKLNKCT